MNHQSFIQDTHNSLETYFNKINKITNSEIDSLLQRLKQKEEVIENLNVTIQEKNNEIKRLSINEKKLTEDYEDFSKVSLLKTAHKNYDKVVKKNLVLQRINNKYKKRIENLKGENKTNKNTINKTTDNHGTVNAIIIDDENSMTRYQRAALVIPGAKSSLVDETVECKDDNNGVETEETDEEVELELLKIQRKYYYVTELDDDTRDIYEAIKIKKNEYDVGGYIGVYKNNLIIKNQITSD